MFLLDEKLFSSGLKLFQIPSSWFRSVSAFLNSIHGENGVKVEKPTSPSADNPVTLSIDEDWLDEKLDHSLDEKLIPEADATNVDTSKTNDGGKAGIEDTTRAAVSGESLAQAAAAVTAEQGGTWTAGGADGCIGYEIARIKPFMVSTAKYGKVFLRKRIYNHNGQLVSQGPEIDQNIIIRLY